MNQKAMNCLIKCFEETKERMYGQRTPEEIEQAKRVTAEVKQSAGVYIEKIETGQAIAFYRIRHHRYRGTR